MTANNTIPPKNPPQIMIEIHFFGPETSTYPHMAGEPIKGVSTGDILISKRLPVLFRVVYFNVLKGC